MGNDGFYFYGFAACTSCICNGQCRQKGQCSIGLERCRYCAEISTSPYKYCGYQAEVEQDLKVSFSNQQKDENKVSFSNQKEMGKRTKTETETEIETEVEKQKGAYPQDSEENEYRYIDTAWLDEIAKGLTVGAVKHPGETWRTIPAREHMYRAMRHISMWLLGDRQEPHIINASMRLMMAFATNKTTNGDSTNAEYNAGKSL